MNRLIQFSRKNKKLLLSLIVILLITLFAGRTLINSKLARTDDLELHGIRVANYYLSLKQDQFPPYWGPNLYYGFGYPVFLFSYHTPYVISTIFYIIGFGIEQSINLLLISTLLLGSFGTFMLSFQINKKYLLAISSTCVYLSAPYILLNYFVRGSIGEITFISLIPWLLWLINIRQNSDKWWYKIISVLILSCLILSHPLSLLIITPIILGYWILIGIRKFPFSFYLSGITSLLITSFSWLPMLLEKKYTVISTHDITNNFVNRFPSFSSLIFSKWGYGGADITKANDVLPTTFGFSIILIILISLWLILKKRKMGELKFEIYWFSVFLISLFLMMPSSTSIWKVSKVLPYIQYPWRLLWVSVLSSIMLLNSQLLNKFLSNKIKLFMYFLIFLIAIFNLVNYAKPLSYISNTDHDWKQHPSTSTSDNELKPIWFDEGFNIALDKNLYLRNNNQQIIEATPSSLVWTGSKMSYQIDSIEEAEILQKTAYFPGWEVKVNGEVVPINYQDENYKGRVIFPIKKGKNNIEVKFTNNTVARESSLYL
ncbi:MAG: 6-pyruvoyl-tetrahydropterin synthase-related protein, partial [Candidatus Pacebacteria bacterium]|nr:6-pyruvoyl-tetrahydropterin synthase-related protein [Candidatus Paceibacterota bacterium]